MTSSSRRIDIEDARAGRRPRHRLAEADPEESDPLRRDEPRWRASLSSGSGSSKPTVLVR